MTLLLDTSVLIALERRNPVVESKIRELAKSHPGPARISCITLFEFMYGAECLPKEEKEDLLKFIWRFSVLQTTNATMWLMSHLAYAYKKKGNSKSITDVFIASHAAEHDLTVVTLDKDFSDISEIKKIVIPIPR